MNYFNNSFNFNKENAQVMFVQSNVHKANICKPYAKYNFIFK